ncbi:Pr6Pr family membrane protein [Aestuariimicrobium soli]|uniref:Pr6Pr family membrane protein n=1 Tax=Aestuariimicrobium soli TaxID=2035834 RepID=UPI003EBA40DB
MPITSRPWALAFRAAALLVIATGILRVSGVAGPEFLPRAFLYYTVMSNLLCLVWMAVLVVTTIVDLRRRGPHGTSTPSPRFSAAVAMAIGITLLIYMVVLMPASFSQPGTSTAFTLTDNLVHLFTPLLLIIDFVAFVPHGRVRRTDPWLWLPFPLVYVIFAFTYSGLGGRFAADTKVPYHFMDVDALGVGGVALWLVGLAVALALVGHLLWLLDRRLGASAEPEHERAPVEA